MERCSDKMMSQRMVPKWSKMAQCGQIFRNTGSRRAKIAKMSKKCGDIPTRSMMGPGCPCSLWLTCAGRKCGGAGQVSAHLVQMLRGSAHLQLGAGRDAGHGVVLARGGGHSRAHPAVLQLLQLDMQLKRAKIPEFSAKFWLENVSLGVSLQICASEFRFLALTELR